MTDWMDRAVCTPEMSPLFFPEPEPRKGARGYDLAWAPARVICTGFCPVKDECLEYAMTNEIPFGMFGGMNPDERRALARARRRRDRRVA